MIYRNFKNFTRDKNRNYNSRLLLIDQTTFGVKKEKDASGNQRKR